jgi:hypothetical protein
MAEVGPGHAAVIDLVGGVLDVEAAFVWVAWIADDEVFCKLTDVQAAPLNLARTLRVSPFLARAACMGAASSAWCVIVSHLLLVGPDTEFLLSVVHAGHQGIGIARIDKYARAHLK